MTAPAAQPRAWLWAAILLVAVKLWFVAGQTIYAIGSAIHDDKLFVLLAEHILYGRWLGPYDQLTLAKGPLYSFFLAGNFWLGLPVLLTQQLLYLTACAAVVMALRPWLRTAGLRFTLFAALLLNPMSYDASNLTRLMRQSLYTPLALFVLAGLLVLFARRHEPWRRLLLPAGFSGLAFGGFWITREESVWLLPTMGLIALGLLFAVRHELRARWRTLTCACGVFLAAFALPILALSAANLSHYGWFGTVEFRAAEFKNAYGALSRIAVGPDLTQVIVSRQMREAGYNASPTFALLQPHLEGPIGAHWIDAERFPAAERQIRGGWFMWALRDAHAAAGLAPDAATALRNYQKIADEINAACDAGRLPARPPRTGFFPRITKDDFGPIWAATLDYLVYFGGFRGFTAQSPDSVGDYAELKPFRDYVGTHLSYAPRTPDPFPPAQSRLQRFQVASLESFGRFTSDFFAWAASFLLLVGLARGLEAVWRRRVTFLLGLGMALLASVAAYLAINILITVTAFRNVSPGAMASAYPLYLIALFAFGLDAARTWSRALPAVGARPRDPLPSRWRWLVPAGALLVIFACRLREIHLYGGDVPFGEQWLVEARQILAPWLEGTLRPWTFFIPHFDQVPAWSRLLVWLETVLTGRWDPILQMTVNTLCYCLFAALVIRWLWRTFSAVPAGFVTVIFVLVGALPHAWENITWAHASAFPLGLLCLWLHVHGSFAHPSGSRRWWLAQAAGAAGLFTLGHMWLAPLAVVATQLWVRSLPASRRAWGVPLALAGIGALWLLLPGAQVGNNAVDFASVLLRFLGWPSMLPGAAAVVFLPWLMLALRLRRVAAASIPDRIVLALGLWTLLQATALAATGGGSLSRHGDILGIGLLANALALIRLLPPIDQPRKIWLTLALLWSGLALSGLIQNTAQGHARYFHQHAADNAHIRRIAVQAYLEKGDATLLEQGTTRWVLTQDTALVASLLDRPDFRALLPTSVAAANPDYGLGRGIRWLLAHWAWALGAGVGLLLAGLVVLRQRGSLRPALPLLLPAAGRGPWLVSVAIAGVSFAGLLLWAGSLSGDRGDHWRQLLGGDAALQGLTFDFSQPREFPAQRIIGAAPVNPPALRQHLRGTALDGPRFTGTIFSSAFTVTKEWLIVPYSGYPIGVGNGLRVQLLAADDSSRVEREIDCLPPNLEGLGFHAADLKSIQGRRARLVLYDGRVDTEAWVAVAPPIPADSPELATLLARRLEDEHSSALPLTLGVVGLVALGGAWLTRRRR